MSTNADRPVWPEIAYRELLVLMGVTGGEDRIVLLSGGAQPAGLRLPTIHNVGTPEWTGGADYRPTVVHCGFGLFRGQTPAGRFYFEAGGAMSALRDDHGALILSWSLLQVDNAAVLADLGLDHGALLASVKRARAIAAAPGIVAETYDITLATMPEEG